ncbi:hypothetical protein Bca52824_050688 [Brassica carinata]|uniref:Pentatricopeptide repeat-containing protein n=1 Tax=Brassica carinata TaxID=52824 RepID=A0A8X7R448_BRACI|nr:hypothetical protein Bca52824_050688 [Brassica carinata]
MYAYNAMACILSRARRNASLKALVGDVLNSRCSMSPGGLGFFFIKCLGNAGLVEEASFVFDRSTEMGLCVPNEYTYNCLLEAISRSNSSLVDLVETRLEEMRRFGFRFDKFTLTPVLQAYCNAGECERAQSLCWFYTKLCWRGLIWCKMLTILFRTSLEMMSLIVSLSLKDHNKASLPDLDCLSSVIDRLVKANEVDNAVRLLHGTLFRTVLSQVF